MKQTLCRVLLRFRLNVREKECQTQDALRNLRLRRLKHRKAKQFQRHALQLVIQDI